MTWSCLKYWVNDPVPQHESSNNSDNLYRVDGTGMCGACRVTVGGKNRFVCVDGPEFDAHQVDFDEMMMRMRAYDKK